MSRIESREEVLIPLREQQRINHGFPESVLCFISFNLAHSIYMKAARPASLVHPQLLHSTVSTFPFVIRHRVLSLFLLGLFRFCRVLGVFLFYKFVPRVSVGVEERILEGTCLICWRGAAAARHVRTMLSCCGRVS